MNCGGDVPAALLLLLRRSVVVVGCSCASTVEIDSDSDSCCGPDQGRFVEEGVSGIERVTVSVHDCRPAL